VGIYLERYGSGKKMLFVHGAGGSSVSWYFQKRLEAAGEVIFLDLPGHGRSAGEGFRTIDGYVESVRTAIRENGLEGCYVAGHSMGGAIAISLALSSPEILGGLVLVATGARLKVFPQILEGLLKDKEGTVRSIIDFAFSKNAPRPLIEAGFAEMMEVPKEVIHGDFSACDRLDLIGRVKEIELPTLVICGSDDVLTPPGYSEYLAGAIRGSKLVLIPHAGHMVMIENAEETNRALEGFLSHR